MKKRRGQMYTVYLQSFGNQSQPSIQLNECVCMPPDKHLQDLANKNCEIMVERFANTIGSTNLRVKFSSSSETLIQYNRRTRFHRVAVHPIHQTLSSCTDAHIGQMSSQSHPYQKPYHTYRSHL
jgi:hypothetical protein